MDRKKEQTKIKKIKKERKKGKMKERKKVKNKMKEREKRKSKKEKIFFLNIQNKEENAFFY